MIYENSGNGDGGRDGGDRRVNYRYNYLKLWKSEVKCRDFRGRNLVSQHLIIPLYSHSIEDENGKNGRVSSSGYYYY